MYNTCMYVTLQNVVVILILYKLKGIKYDHKQQELTTKQQILDTSMTTYLSCEV